MTVHVERSCILDSPADRVWSLLRDFNGHADWHPAVATSAIEGGEPADLVGAVRAFRMTDGSFMREQLIALSDRDMSLTYCLLEAPLRLFGYVATMRLRRVTAVDGTYLNWRCRFDAAAQEADALAQVVGEDVYGAGMAALRLRLAGGTKPDAVAVAKVRRPSAISRPASSSPVHSDAGGVPSIAIVVERHGGPEVLVPRTIAVPAPGLGEVRLRQRVIGVNSIDVHGRAGDFGLATLPAVPGLEAVAEVTDLGAGVTHLSVGDRVVYASAPPGAYSEVRTMPADRLVRLPSAIDDETGAAVFLKGIMADLLLHDVHALRAGETVLVHAAAGGVGLLLCGWARALGAVVIGVVSTDAKAAAAAAAGCSHVVVSGRQDVGTSVAVITAGRGVDVVYDGIGHATVVTSLAVLARRGHLVSFGQVSGPLVAGDLEGLLGKSIHLSRPNFLHFTETPEELHRRADRLFDAVRRGWVRPVIDRRVRLSDAADAHRRLEARENIGALLLIP